MSLYVSASGKEVSHVSSSSLDSFRFCRRKFKLSRIDGWKQKDRKASLEIGKCLESALQFFYENGLKTGDFEDEWRRLWLKFAEIPLVYTPQEKDWATIYQLGVEWAKLFTILRPTMPIEHPKFQLCFKKELWPGDPLYGGLEFLGYIDILSTLSDGSRLVIDVKTAKNPLSVAPGMMALDGQLRKYSWVSGIREVGFLNFCKCDPNSLKKGSDITLLTDILEYKAGTTLVVWKFCPPTEEDKRTQLTVASEEVVQKMETELEDIKGKGSTERKEAVIASYVEKGDLFVVDREDITRAKIQFVKGTIPEKDLSEIGQQIGADMMAVKYAADTNGFFKDGGVRFPNAICSWCEMLPICNRNDSNRDATLVQIKADSDDWLKELETEETE